MNKQELVDKVAKKAGNMKKDAQATIDATIDAIMETVKKGGKVTLVASARSLLSSAKPAKAETRRPAKRSVFLLVRARNLPPVKHSKKKSSKCQIKARRKPGFGISQR